MYVNKVFRSAFHHWLQYSKYTKVSHIISNKIGKQTFVVKLNGLTALGCCCKITLVNNTCNIHLVLMFWSWSSYQQSGEKVPPVIREFDFIYTNLNNYYFSLTGSFWRGSAAGGRQWKIQTGFLDLHFSVAHFGCPDWKLQPGGARHSTDTPCANTLPWFRWLKISS